MKKHNNIKTKIYVMDSLEEVIDMIDYIWERKAKEDEVKAKDSGIEVIDKKGRELQTLIDWHRDYGKATSDFNEAQDKADAAKIEVESEAFQQKEKEINDWNSTVKVRANLALYELAQRKKLESATQLEALEGDFIKAVAGSVCLAKQLEGKRVEKGDLDEVVAAQQVNASAYGNVQSIVAGIEGMGRTAAQIASKENSLKNCKHIFCTFSTRNTFTATFVLGKVHKESCNFYDTSFVRHNNKTA